MRFGNILLFLITTFKYEKIYKNMLHIYKYKNKIKILI